MQERAPTQDVAPEPESAGPAAAGGGESSQDFAYAGAIPPVAEPPPDGSTPSASELAYGGGTGAPLPADVRGRFEASLGADLSRVRVHTDDAAAATARRHGARALAVGTDIHFAHGQYDPHGAAGQELLAHEVAHTVQQRDASPMPQAARDHDVPGPTDGAEVEADHAARAMVTGARAHVTPVAHQAPHADKKAPEPPDSWNNQMLAIAAARGRSDWADVARRLNGLSTDDIFWYVETKMKDLYGQIAHTRAAAPEGGHVAEQIDKYDAKYYGGKLAKIAVQYDRYDHELADARKDHHWHDVIDRLNGMGEPDILARVRKLTWAEYEEIRAQTDNQRVLGAIDKANDERGAAAARAYHTAITNRDFDSAVRQLHAMSQTDLDKAIDTIRDDPKQHDYLRYLKAAAHRVIPANWPQRVIESIDRAAQKDGGAPIDTIKHDHLVEIPDISDDTRELKSVSLANFADNKAIAKFADDLATEYASKRATVAKDKRNKEWNYTAPESYVDKYDELRKSWLATATHYAQIGYWPTVASFGKRWMVEVREKGERFAGENWDYKNPTKTDKSEFVASRLVDLKKPPGGDDGGQKVHPWTNEFIEQLGTDYEATTYIGHGEQRAKTKDGKPGEWSGDWAPLCLDLKPKILPDARGFYEPEQMFDFIKRIDKAAQGNWAGIYNDTSLIRHAQAHGFAGKLSSTADDLSGSHNFHGPLNPHIHVYLKPPHENWVPHPATAPKIDPDKEP